jgi:cytochrome c biogenesis protein CcmG/thiol:disulfide interchange protein DsbE
MGDNEGETATGPARSRSSRLRRHLTLGNLIFVVLLAWITPRLLPHLGAVVGVRSGPAITPEYSYESLAGELIASDSLRGKVVLVNFWATWCAPCRAEMPLLEAMYKRHRESGFVIVGLAVDRAPTADVAAYVRARGVTYPIAHVGSEAERRFGGVRGYPTSFLIDRDGSIVQRVMGPIGPLSLEPAVRRALTR